MARLVTARSLSSCHPVYHRAVATNPDRSSHFPAIEKKHGMPMLHWFDVMREIGDLKYAEQIAYLRENHGFSQAHANALVLYSKGNTTSKRFSTIDDYLTGVDPVAAETAREIFRVLQAKWKRSTIVIAWNQPMLKIGETYVFGLNVLKNYILISPLSGSVIEEFADRMTDYKVNKKTIQVPSDWKPDAKLLRNLVAARIAETSD